MPEPAQDKNTQTDPQNTNTNTPPTPADIQPVQDDNQIDPPPLNTDPIVGTPKDTLKPPIENIPDTQQSSDQEVQPVAPVPPIPLPQENTEDISQPKPVGFTTASMQNPVPPADKKSEVPPKPPSSDHFTLKDQGKKGRRIIFAVVTIVLVIVFSALGYYIYSRFFQGNRVGSTKPISLTYWGLWESKEIMQPIIDAYQKENPNVTINYEERSPEFYFETILSRLGKDSGPDIVRIHSSWVKPLQNKLSALPNTVMDKETYEKTFYNVTQSTLSIDEVYYAIPIEYDGLALIYNESLFLEAGIKTAPKTWEEFRDTAKKLTKREKDENGEEQIVQSGAAIGFSNIEHFSDLLGLLMVQNGVAFEDETGLIAFDTTIAPDGRNLGGEALSFYSIFSKGDDLVWNEDWLSAHDAFTTGKLAMMFGPSWRVMNLLEANKNLKIKVASVPQIPLGENETTNVNWGSFWAEAVSKTAKDQAVAWDFLKFITEREQMVKMFTISSEERIFGEPYSRQDLYSSLSSDPYLAPYVKAANSATSWSMNDQTYDSVYNDEIIDAFAEAVDAVNAGTSADTVIKSTAQKVKVIIDGL